MDAYIADPRKNTCTSTWSTWHTVNMGTNVVGVLCACRNRKMQALYSRLTSFYDSDRNNLSLFWCRKKNGWNLTKSYLLKQQQQKFTKKWLILTSKTNAKRIKVATNCLCCILLNRYEATFPCNILSWKALQGICCHPIVLTQWWRKCMFPSFWCMLPGDNGQISLAVWCIRLCGKQLVKWWGFMLFFVLQIFIPA